jgi:ribosomal-protein-alanine N-acetyltransferase
MNVAVAPEWRRQGVATRLIEQLLGEAGGEDRYTLEVRASNRDAIRMYERLGFRPAGHRRRYYHDNGEDALIMWFEAPTAVGA